MTDNNSSKWVSWLPTERTCGCAVDAMNCLSEREWLRNQVPIWWFIAKDLNTRFDSFSRQRHPAIFPSALVKRVVKNYTHENETVLDPFSGVGTTLFAAQVLRRNCVGFEINEKFSAFTSRRLGLKNDEDCPITASTHRRTNPGQHIQNISTDCTKMDNFLPPNSIDLVFTSPPYWDLLKQAPSRRNLRNKKYLKNNYSDNPSDLSNSPSLETFVGNLRTIFQKAHLVLKPGGRCVINTADYRRKGKFISLSSIYISILHELDFELKNVMIWDRRKEYNIGLFSYPRNFIVNNGMFEYILEFKK